ncbi:MAG: UPF0149 family protein [Gammaproteobacteria bacterium]
MAVKLLPPIADAQAALTALQATASAAESHGLLCGLICNTLEKKPVDKRFWEISELISKGLDDKKLERYKRTLSQMLKISRKQLKEMDFNFELMLTEEGLPLVDRVNELSHWCGGFVAGLGKDMIEAEKKKKHSPEFGEAIEKLIETAGISYTAVEEASEEDEGHFVDVVEFIRVAVLLVASELIAEESNGSSAKSSLFQ